MRKGIIRGFGFLAFCFLMSVIPVKAADSPVTLVNEGDEVKVMLSKDALEDEVHSLHLGFEIEVAQGELKDVSFQWAEGEKWASGEGVYKKEYRTGEGGHIILDVYVSAKEDLFSSGSGLTLGTVKLTAADGGATTLVRAENLNTVNSVQEMYEDSTSFVEVTTGEDLVQPPEDGNGGNGSGDNTGSGSGDNTGSGSGDNTGGGSGDNTGSGGGSGIWGWISGGGSGGGASKPGSSQKPNMTPTGTVSGNKGGNLANHIKNKLDTASGTTDDSLAWKPREPEEGTGDSLPEDNAFSFQEEAGVSDSFEDFIEEAKEERSKGMGQGVKIFLIVCAGLAAAGGGASAILLYTGSRAQRSRALTKKNQGGKKHKKKHKKG